MYLREAGAVGVVGDMPPESSRDDSSTVTSFHSPQLKFLYEP